MGLRFWATASYTGIVVLTVSALSVVVADAFGSDTERSQAIAAWAQAIGAVLAIFISVGLAQWQLHRQQTEADRMAKADQLRAALDADTTVWAAHTVILNAGGVVQAIAIEPNKGLTVLDTSFPKATLRMFRDRLGDQILDLQRLLQQRSNYPFLIMLKDIREQLRKAHGHCETLIEQDIWTKQDVATFTEIGKKLMRLQDSLGNVIAKLSASLEDVLR